MNIKSIITAVMALLVSSACNGGAKQETVMTNDGKALVVFFSHAGDNYAVGNIEVGNWRRKKPETENFRNTKATST